MRLLVRLFAIVVTMTSLSLGVAAQATVKKLTVNIDTTKAVRDVGKLPFGLNVANISGAQAQVHRNALVELGEMTWRYPGGLVNDLFDWTRTSADGSADNAGTPVPTPWADFVQLCRDVSIPFSKVQIGVNYGTKPMSLAVEWVRDANIVRKLGIQYWEIGNEQWLDSEPDLHGSTLADGTVLPGKAHDPDTYGTEAAKFLKAMKAVDPTIKVGVHVNNSAYSQTVYEAMKRQGVMPDYVIYHCYPLSRNPDDVLSLTHARTYLNNLEGELLTDLKAVFGKPGGNVELFLNEYNSSYRSNKQTTSLVNGLYEADVVGSSLYTALANVTWFTYRHSMSNILKLGYNDEDLYGWRRYLDESGGENPYGDIQLLSTETNDKYPTFYITKLLQRFLADGGTVVDTDLHQEAFLAVFTLKDKAGGLKLLVLNKAAETVFDTTLRLKGNVPKGTVSVLSYGKENDTAAATGGGDPDLSRSTTMLKGKDLVHRFPPYSATLFLLGPSTLDVTPPSAPKVAQSGEASYDQVSLQWQPVPGAHHYDVSYRPGGFVNTYWTLADSVTGTTATVKSLKSATGYTFQLRAVDAAGNASVPSNPVQASTQVLTHSLPFRGAPFSLPGHVEAAEFDLGGQTLAYYDVEPSNLGSEGRLDQGVDTQQCTLGGLNVGWTKQGEWLNYTVTVAHSGWYTITLAVASPQEGGEFHLELNKKPLTPVLKVPNTGGWQLWKELVVDVELPQGDAVLRLVMDRANLLTTGNVGNFKTLTFAPRTKE